jgi:hypothetical protein
MDVNQQPATPPKAPTLPQSEVPVRVKVSRAGSLRPPPADRAELPEQTAEERVAGLLNPKLRKGAEREADPDDAGDDTPAEDDRPSRRESPSLREEREAAEEAETPAEQPATDDDVPDSLDDEPGPNQQVEGDAWEEMEYTAPNGKKYTIPKPLVDGAMMQADYTRGKEEIAQERKFNVALRQRTEIDGAIQAELGPAVSELRQLEQQIENYRLQKNQPGITVQAYIEIDRQLSGLTDTYDKYRGAVAQRSSELSAQKQAAVTALQSAADQFLSKTLPKWTPAAKRATEQYMVEAGLEPAEIQQMYDPRVIRAFHDAALLKKIQSKRTATVKQVQQAAPVVRPQGRTSNATTEAQQTGRLKVQAQRSGKPADAEDAITRMLKSARARR